MNTKLVVLFCMLTQTPLAACVNHSAYSNDLNRYEPPEEIREAMESMALLGILIFEGFWIDYLRSNRVIREFEEKGGIIWHTSEGLFTPDLSFSNTWRIECRLPRFTGTASDLKPVLLRLNVQELTVHGSPDSPMDGTFLTALADDELRALDLENVVVDELSMRCLAENSGQLVSLRLHSQLLSDSQLELLDRCPRLQQLIINSDAVTDRSLAAVLRTSRDIEYIEVIGKKVDGSFLTTVMGPLYSLRMDHCGVTDVALKELRRFPELEVLSIDSSRRVTDEGMKSIRLLNNLVGLNISGAAIGKVGLSSLARLESLKTLVIDDCKGIRDDCVEAISRMPALERLSIQNTGLSESAVKRLRERMPDCKIAVTDDERWVDPFSGTILDLD
jgi:hypothetical protein